MNKRIFYICFEIIILIIFIPVSYLWWNIFDHSTSSAIAKEYAAYDSKLEINTKSNITNLVSLKDEDKMGLVNITINNNSNLKKEYNLYLKFDNDTELNKNYLKLSINNNVYNLNELKNFTKGQYTYYLINTSNIKSNGKNLHNVYLFLSKDTPNTEQNKNFNIAFNVEEI